MTRARCRTRRSSRNEDDRAPGLWRRRNPPAGGLPAVAFQGAHRGCSLPAWFVDLRAAVGGIGLSLSDPHPGSRRTVSSVDGLDIPSGDHQTAARFRSKRRWSLLLIPVLFLVGLNWAAGRALLLGLLIFFSGKRGTVGLNRYGPDLMAVPTDDLPASHSTFDPAGR